MSQGIAWRLFTKGISPTDAEQHATIEGDHQLGKQVLEMVSVIALGFAAVDLGGVRTGRPIPATPRYS